MKQRGHFFIEGRVQGVCFRMCAQEEAMHLGLTGWVRNLPDGRVEIMAEGEEQDVRKFLAWCRHGPPHAMVMDVDFQFSQFLSNSRSFEVTH